MKRRQEKRKSESFAVTCAGRRVLRGIILWLQPGSLRRGGGGRRVPVVEWALRLPDSRLLGVRLRLCQRQLLEDQEPWAD